LNLIAAVSRGISRNAMMAAADSAKSLSPAACAYIRRRTIPVRFIMMIAAGAVACCFAAACNAQVTVSNRWVRATVPGQTIAGAYFKITSASAAYLVGGSSPAAKAVELHGMSLENNVMKMRRLARLELPAGRTVELKPGSYHLMLVDIVHPLAAGERVPLKLTIEDKSGRRQMVDVKAEVGEPQAAGAQHGIR
jgi:hypothetical protein